MTPTLLALLMREQFGVATDRDNPMRNSTFAAVCVMGILTSGCSTLSRTAAEANKLVIVSDTLGPDLQRPGAIYVWPPHASAAVLDNEGNRCVLAASGAKTIQAEAEAGLKLQGLKEVLGDTNLDVSQKEKLVEAFTKLSQLDEDGAFADMALFHLCILDQNGTFGTDKDTGQLKPKAEPMLKAFLRTIEIARLKPSGPARGAGGE